MSSYSDSKPEKKKRGRPKKVVKEPEPEPEPTPAPAPAPKKKKAMGKLTEKQRAELKSHMEKHKKAGMSPSEVKSHRMSMMVRLRKGMSVKQAHSDIMKSK